MAKLMDAVRGRRRRGMNVSLDSTSFREALEKSQSQSTIWESFREASSEEETLSEDETTNGSIALDEDTKRKRRLEKRHRQALLNNSKIMMLPAGIDTGKFLENQLKRVSNEGVGPKKIVELLD